MTVVVGASTSSPTPSDATPTTTPSRSSSPTPGRARRRVRRADRHRRTGLRHQRLLHPLHHLLEQRRRRPGDHRDLRRPHRPTRQALEERHRRPTTRRLTHARGERRSGSRYGLASATPATPQLGHTTAANGHPIRHRGLSKRPPVPCPPSRAKLQAWRDAGADPAEKPPTFFRLTAVFDPLSRICSVGCREMRYKWRR
jgi:hypothetical protein